MDHLGRIKAIEDLANIRISEEKTRTIFMQNIQELDSATLEQHFSDIMENIEDFGEKARMIDGIDQALKILESSSKNIMGLNKELDRVEKKYEQLSAHKFLDSSFL